MTNQGDPQPAAAQPQDLLAELSGALERAAQLKQQLETALSEGARAPSPEQIDALHSRLADIERDRQDLAARLVDTDLANARLLNLYVATYQLHAKLDPATVIQTIAEISVNLLGAERFVLLIKTTREGVCEIAASEGLQPGEAGPFQGAQYRGGDPAVDLTLTDGVLRVGPFEESYALAVVPLVTESTVIGALVVLGLFEHKAALADGDRELLDLIGAHAASALVAARAYSTTHRRLRTLEELIAPSRSLQGNLGDVSITDVLQFVHLGRRTGTLHMYQDERRAAIGLHDGRIVRASVTGGTRVGDILVADGLVPRGTLDEALWRQSQQEPRPFIGQVLVAMGALSPDAARRALEQQIEQTIFHLVTWKAGTFEFVTDDLSPVDAVGIDPSEFLPDLDLNTEMLLLDAMRLADEAAQAARTAPASPPSDQRPAGAPAATSESAFPSGAGGTDDIETAELDAAGSVVEEIETLDLDAPAFADHEPSSPGQPRRAYPVLGRLRDLLKSLRAGIGGGAITSTLMKALSGSASRAVFFLVAREELVAIDAFGVPPGARKLRVPIAEAGALGHCVTEAAPRSYAAGPGQLPAQVLWALGTAPDQPFVLFPVLGAQRVIAVVYADGLDPMRGEEELEVIELAVTQVGIALENELLRRQINQGGGGS